MAASGVVRFSLSVGDLESSLLFPAVIEVLLNGEVNWRSGRMHSSSECAGLVDDAVDLGRLSVNPGDLRRSSGAEVDGLGA